MKCPRCREENNNRTVCKKCGYYLYRANSVNVAKMTKAERAREDAKIVGKSFWKVFRVIWIIIVIVIMSFWILAALMYFTGVGLY